MLASIETRAEFLRVRPIAANNPDTVLAAAVVPNGVAAGPCLQDVIGAYVLRYVPAGHCCARYCRGLKVASQKASPPVKPGPVLGTPPEPCYADGVSDGRRRFLGLLGTCSGLLSAWVGVDIAARALRGQPSPWIHRRGYAAPLFTSKAQGLVIAAVCFVFGIAFVYWSLGDLFPKRTTGPVSWRRGRPRRSSR